MAIFAQCHNVLIENCPIVTVRGCDRCHNLTPVWVICNCTIKASENRESEHNVQQGIPGCKSRTDYLKIQKLLRQSVKTLLFMLIEQSSSPLS